MTIFDDFSGKNDGNQRKRRKTQENQGNERKYTETKKLRPGQPGTGGRAGPVEFGPRKKMRFFHPVTQGPEPDVGIPKASYRLRGFFKRIPFPELAQSVLFPIYIIVSIIVYLYYSLYSSLYYSLWLARSRSSNLSPGLEGCLPLATAGRKPVR